MHRNARLTLWGRQELVRRINSGVPIARNNRPQILKLRRAKVSDAIKRSLTVTASKPANIG